MTLPPGMVPYGPDHRDYPNEATDWDRGLVARRDGSVTSAGTTNAWNHDRAGVQDYDIVGYTSKLTEPAGDVFFRNLRNLSDDERADIGRVLRGEAEDDRVRRGDVHEAIRSLRTGPVPSIEYQRALSHVALLVSKLAAQPSREATALGAQATGIIRESTKP